MIQLVEEVELERWEQLVEEVELERWDVQS